MTVEGQQRVLAAHPQTIIDDPDATFTALLELDSEEFGGVLRPVFQKDEWKLVLAGGVIGAIIGALQVIFLFGGF